MQWAPKVHGPPASDNSLKHSTKQDGGGPGTFEVDCKCQRARVTLVINVGTLTETCERIIMAEFTNLLDIHLRFKYVKGSILRTAKEESLNK